MIASSRSAFLASTAAAAALAAAPRLAGAQATQRLRIAGVFSDLFGEPWYAKESGIFARAGFDVELSSLVNAGAVAAAIGGGSLEMGVGDLVSGVNAIMKGVPILLIAGSGMQVNNDSGTILAVPNDSPIHQPKDMTGKTIAVPTLVGLATSSVRTWLPQHGVPLASVKIVEMPQGAMVAAMQRGVIDVGLLSEPFTTMAKNDTRNVGEPLDAIAREFLVSVWYASKTWIEADRERARKIVGLIYDTARWANTHHDETFQILVRDGKLDADKVKGMSRVQFATSLTPALVQPVLNIAASVKALEHPVDASTLIAKL